MARPPKFEITDGRSGPAVTVSVTGELDVSTVQTLAEHVDGHLSAGVSDVTLDLGDIAFLDSTGLKLLIELNNRSLHHAWRLTLIPPRHEEAALVLRATGADVNLPFVPSVGG